MEKMGSVKGRKDGPTGGVIGITKKHVAVLIAASVIPSFIVPLALPAVKESVLSYFYRSHYIEGYIGDGILIGDADIYNIPFSTVNWVVSQSPGRGDSYHTVSIYVVPAHVARKSVSKLRRRFVSEAFQVANEETTQSIGMRTYVYILPRKYLRGDQVAKIEYQTNVLGGIGGEPMGHTVFWFQNRESYLNFIEKEPQAESEASGCKCVYEDEQCPKDDSKCREKVKADAMCFDSCKLANNKLYFTANNSSYNYYSIFSPMDSFVQYNTTIDMFFYDHTKLGDYYKCTIRSTDECPFQTPGFTLFPQQRDLVIAYIHPTTIPAYTTTRLWIQSKVQIHYSNWVVVMFLCMVAVIIKHCLRGIFG